MNDVLDRLPGGFLSFRDDGVILASNRTLRDMLGYEDATLEGGSIEGLFTLPSRIFYQTHLFPLLKIQDRVEEIYLTLRTKTGEGLPVLLNARTLVVEGETQHECLAIPMHNRDKYEAEILRARKVAEQAVQDREAIHQSLQSAHEILTRQQDELAVRHQELETLSALLEGRVRDRTAELEQLVLELSSLNYSIAHTLRAPMRAILSISSILHAESSESLSNEQNELLGRQKLNVETLASMIDDWLQLSRLLVNLPFKEPIDVSALAKSAASKALVGRESEFTVTIKTGLSACADKSMISTALECLMSNAVKYSPGGGKIVFSGKASESGIVCSIQDEGIGMDLGYVHHIFEPFARLHREEFPGNGIGLAIVERILRHHGGKVWVESELGKGSTFYFTLS